MGLYSPFKYGIENYEGYDIKKFRNNIRFLEVLEDRDYGSNGQICPLYFNGATSFFQELPLPNQKEELERWYDFLEQYHSKTFQFFNFIKRTIYGIANSKKRS